MKSQQMLDMSGQLAVSIHWCELNFDHVLHCITALKGEWRISYLVDWFVVFFANWINSNWYVTMCLLLITLGLFFYFFFFLIKQFSFSRMFRPRGKYQCTIDLLCDRFRLVCFANKNTNCQLLYSWFQTSQTGGQRYRDTSPFSIPWWGQ